MLNLFRKRSMPTAEQLRESLPDALGDRLLSLIRYYPDGPPDEEDGPGRVHLLIVLDDVDIDVLSASADAIQATHEHNDVAQMVLSEAELHASTDVFPITFLEMQRHYEVLAGADVLADLPVSDQHLRLRCEQELKNLLIRMQSAFLVRSQSVEALRDSLGDSHSTLLRCLRWAIRLSGEELPEKNEDVVNIAVDRFDLNKLVMERVEESAQLDLSVGATTFADIYGMLLVEVHRIANVVDEMEADEIVELDSVEEQP